METALELHFHRFDSLVLERVVFRCSLLTKARCSVRGKNTHRPGCTGNFDWSAAVRALCLLFLRAKVDRSALLCGEEARTLDYAIARKPLWLQELFCDRDNQQFMRRLFVRSNPEGRRPLPLTVGLHQDVWHSANIAIFVDRLPVTDPRQISELALALHPSNPAKRRALEWLRQGIKFEVTAALQNMQVLDGEYIRKLASEYYAIAPIRKLGGRELLRWLSAYGPERMQFLGRQRCVAELSDSPITVLAPPLGVGTSALVRYLRDRWQLPLEIFAPFASQYRTACALQQGEIGPLPDLVCLGIVPALQLMKHTHKHDYMPLVPAVGGADWLVRPDSASGKLLSIAEFPTNLDLISSQLRIEEPRLATQHASQAQVVQHALRGELSHKSLVFGVFGPAVASSGALLQRGSTKNSPLPLELFFARKAFAMSRRGLLFSQVVRQALSAMMFDSRAPHQAVAGLMRDEEVVFQLLEEGGLLAHQ